MATTSLRFTTNYCNPTSNMTTTTTAPAADSFRKQLVYLVRHAEATHNIKEREAVQAAKLRGVHEKEEQEKARRSVLQDKSLTDAPLSDDGETQVRRVSKRLSLLDKAKYPPPKIVLVSPLRRALMTATQLFWRDADDTNSTGTRPRFIALEILREKRTGYAADERMPVEVLEREFPHVNFEDLKRVTPPIAKGEDNSQVRARGRAFLEDLLARVPAESVAIVTHKGWLRELRKTVKEWVDENRLEVDFDLDGWYQTLFGNAEVRVADFGWRGQTLKRIVSKSVENALREKSIAPLPEKSSGGKVVVPDKNTTKVIAASSRTTKNLPSAQEHPALNLANILTLNLRAELGRESPFTTGR